jgi:hypothetical protein
VLGFDIEFFRVYFNPPGACPIYTKNPILSQFMDGSTHDNDFQHPPAFAEAARVRSSVSPTGYAQAGST